LSSYAINESAGESLMLRQFQISLLMVTLALLLTACGGSGLLTATPPPPAPAETEPTSTEVAQTEPTATTPTGEKATQIAQMEGTATAPAEPKASQIAEAAPTAAADPLPGEIHLPPGFKIGFYARNVPNARSMALSPNGTLFVGTRQAGNLYAVLDRDQDYRADEVLTLGQGMNAPNERAQRRSFPRRGAVRGRDQPRLAL
jgi:glucose/arabinose dehydrogenase